MKSTAQTKVLIIDDQEMSIENLVSLLKKVGIQENNISETTDPEKGVTMANHNFDYIFIDFKFDNSDKNGAYYGNLIRQKTGVPALILVTAHGDREENIQEFIWVGFDAFILKKGEASILREGKTIKSILDIAFLNSQKRLKSWFTEDELAGERAALDRFEALVRAGFTKVIHLAPGEHLLRLSPEFYDNTSKSINSNKVRELNELLGNAPKLPKFKLCNQQKKRDEQHKLNNQTSLNEHFKVYEKGLFVAEERALKARQLLIENPTEWPKFRKCSPLVDYKKKKRFLSHFDINAN